jgi:serine/threonine-protein kinase
VLCVDDEERVLNALSTLLGTSFEVETASSGAAALERLGARRFQALISDQRMPGMTGVEVLREARRIAPSTLRILLTGYSDLAAIVGSVNDSEVFRFISKPWQSEDLLATVNEAVGIAIAIEAAAARGKAPPQSDAAALVLGDAALGRAARELAQGGFRVIEAPDLDEALRRLAAEEVGVLLFDLDAQPGGSGEDPAALLRVVKKQSPATQLLVASQASDSELIISLINEARIYRFLKKPVNLSLLKDSLGQALARYARMRESPEFARLEAAKRGRDSAAASAILGKLRSLGGRFAAAIRRS